MDLSTREDIEAPVEFVFAALSDFGSFERAALLRGAEVVRIDGQAEIGPGAAWRAAFALRGKPRQLDITLTGYDVPNLLRFDGESKNLTADLTFELLDLSPRRTRATVRLDLHPRTLSARIAMQSLRLAKARTRERFRRRMRDYLREIEGRYRSGA